MAINKGKLCKESKIENFANFGLPSPLGKSNSFSLF